MTHPEFPSSPVPSSSSPAAAPPSPKRLDRLRDTVGNRGASPEVVTVYVLWCLRFLPFHPLHHPSPVRLSLIPDTPIHPRTLLTLLPSPRSEAGSSAFRSRSRSRPDRVPTPSSALKRSGR
jgi:hypothetical protein